MKMMLILGVIIAVLSTALAQQNSTICTGVPHNTFIQDVARCNGWFRCTANGPISGTCPSPWVFNPTIRECDWEANVQCFRCPATQPIVNLPVEGSCIQFIRCLNNVPSQHACQSGLLFNPATGQCDLESEVECTEPDFTCPPNIPPGEMIAFRDSQDCSVFFICAGSPTPVRDQCNPALHFDPVTQQCTFPHLTDCPNGITTTTENPDGPGNGGEIPFTCPSDGHHPHPNTCASFIVCAGGSPHFFQCSDGLHFNIRTNQCDLPANAQCFRN